MDSFVWLIYIHHSKFFFLFFSFFQRSIFIKHHPNTPYMFSCFVLRTHVAILQIVKKSTLYLIFNSLLRKLMSIYNRTHCIVTIKKWVLKWRFICGILLLLFLWLHSRFKTYLCRQWVRCSSGNIRLDSH